MELVKEEKSYYGMIEVRKILGCSDDKAYKIIRSLKNELISEGKLIPDYPAGKVPKRYFEERCGID